MFLPTERTGMNDVFEGFPADLFDFLEDIGTNNNQQWFRKHYDRYQTSLVLPAKRFVASIGEFIHVLNPQFDIQPKFNRTLMRISRDARFAKGKPYRDYFLIGFHRWKWDSELFVYFDARGAEIGLFINNKKKQSEPSMKKTYETKPSLVRKVCTEYGIGTQYSVSELGKDISSVAKSFNVVKHGEYFTTIPLLIISKLYSKAKIVQLKEHILGEAITHFSTLYPLWILAESTQPEADLMRHSEKLGPVRSVE